MSAEITPAVQRLAEKQFREYDSEYSTDGMTVADFHHTAREDLTVALDVEEMACAMWVSDHPYYTPQGWDTEPSEASRGIYRALARAARVSILGADS